MANVFITGGTGYIGQALIPRLLERGHKVRALVRPGSEHKLPNGCTPVIGNALDRSTYIRQILPVDTFIHLVGVSHPNPSKAEQFRSIDLVAGQQAITAAAEIAIPHFVYLSVGQPAPVMKAYIAVRAECERLIREKGLNATVLRPWYVLGPGHRWPYLLLPMYWALERLPSTRDGARRLGLVTLAQMVSALAISVENPCPGVQVFDVPKIRACAA